MNFFFVEHGIMVTDPALWPAESAAAIVSDQAAMSEEFRLPDGASVHFCCEEDRLFDSSTEKPVRESGGGAKCDRADFEPSTFGKPANDARCSVHLGQIVEAASEYEHRGGAAMSIHRLAFRGHTNQLQIDEMESQSHGAWAGAHKTQGCSFA